MLKILWPMVEAEMLVIILEVAIGFVTPADATYCSCMR